MKVTLTSATGGVFQMEIGSDLVVRDLLALAELETDIPQTEMLLVHNMAPMVEPMKTVREYGVEEGDVIVVSRMEGGGVAVRDPVAGPSRTSQVRTKKGVAHSPLLQFS